MSRPLVSKPAGKTIHKLSDLTPDSRNANAHTERGVGMLEHSLRTLGAGRSIVVDRDGHVIAGNATLERAVELGLGVQVVKTRGDQLVVVQREDLDLNDPKARELAIADNRVAEVDLSWDAANLTALQADGLDLKPWFFEEELAEILGTDGPKEGNTDPDAVPQERATSIVAGDLFELGSHRLLCGDCTVAGDVARLMGDARADLVFTSPPYDQQRDYKGISSDWLALMAGAFSSLPTHETTQVLVNLGLIHRDNEWLPYWDGWIEWMRGQGWRRFGLYVWDQMHGLRGDWAGRFAPSFELVFHFNKQAIKPKKWMESLHAGERGGQGREHDGSFRQDVNHEIQPFKIPDSVWRAQRQKGGIDGHPAPYSVALCDIALKSWPGLVYEPFAGSGTTLISAEGLGQRCYGIEIAPSYCQVIIDRWEAFTGKTAVKVGDAVLA